MTKILLVGGGGREHALAWKLKQDDPQLDLVSAPGNPGIAELARCAAVGASDLQGLVTLAERERPDVVVIGPEAPLGDGLADLLAERRIPVFGPSREAAALESSKRFAKQVMRDAGVPTAPAETHVDAESAKAAVRRFGAPVVIKASGLAAGKGVIVCQTLEEADRAVDLMLRANAFGEAGSQILVEAFMSGEELSLFAVTDGTIAVPLLPVQDHKRLLDGDQGPNTGGMGAYAPVSLGTPELVDTVMRTIVEPTLATMRAQGRPFRGLLYVGLMLTAEGPRVVEFNCRFGDPETQAILPLMESSLLELVRAVAVDGSLAGVAPPRWRPASAVTTIVAAAGYPDGARTGDVVVPPSGGDDLYVFHAGTRRREDGALVSAGGRVLAVTAVAPTLADARDRSRAAAAQVGLAGKQLRTDIAWRELERQGVGHAGAA